MKKKRFSSVELNNIITELLETTEKSRQKALKCHESLLGRVLDLENKIEIIKERMNTLDSSIRETTKISKNLRGKLVTVTKYAANNQMGKTFTYEEIYKQANDSMIELKDMEAAYTGLFKRHNKLQVELKEARQSFMDSNELIQSIGTSFKYLNNDLSNVGIRFEEQEAILLRIIEAGEREKKSIARDLHDGPAQTLAYLSLELQALNTLINRDEKELALQVMNKITHHTKEVIGEMRDTIYNLRPMILDDLGLVAMLQSYVGDFQAKTNIKVICNEVQNKNAFQKLPDSLDITVFRIIQETLNNAYKHSGAKVVRVDFKETNDNFIITVSDKGKGFNSEDIFDDLHLNGHYGLLGIRERIELINGSFDIVSKVNEGTEVIVTIPKEIVDINVKIA